MDYYGQLPKYPINRPLTEDERADQLKQKKRVEVDPHYNLSVIRINSTYLEIVDKFYAWKGLMFSLSTVFLIMVGIALANGFFPINSMETSARTYDTTEYITFLITISLMGIPAMLFFGWLALRESFTYTHYPIVLNRKTRMVHVFRRDGTVLSVPWDDLFFTFNKGPYYWNIRGHVLDADGVTVKETFAFPMFGDKKDILVEYWEFVRRYMEDGPAKLIGHDIGKVEICHPLVGRKEGFKVGMLVIYAQLWFLPIVFWILSPFLTLCGIFRYLANLTCDGPEWPKRVLDTCVIEPGDPHERDARHNPRNAK